MGDYSTIGIQFTLSCGLSFAVAAHTKDANEIVHKWSAGHYTRDGTSHVGGHSVVPGHEHTVWSVSIKDVVAINTFRLDQLQQQQQPAVQRLPQNRPMYLTSN